MLSKIEGHKNRKLTKEKLLESFQGWNAYAKWANSYKLRERIRREMLNLINPPCVK